MHRKTFLSNYSAKIWLFKMKSEKYFSSEPLKCVVSIQFSFWKLINVLFRLGKKVDIKRFEVLKSYKYYSIFNKIENFIADFCFVMKQFVNWRFYSHNSFILRVIVLDCILNLLALDKCFGEAFSFAIIFNMFGRDVTYCMAHPSGK